ncbi:MAG: MaoC/PaaZ C-terminal domain-containing protein [Planctomycetota bacterium]
MNTSVTTVSEAVGKKGSPGSVGANASASKNAGEATNVGLAAEILFAEQLSVGDSWTTPLREISESDVQSFAELTGDHTPLHGNSSSESPYGKPIAHGLLGLSVLAGLGTSFPHVSTLALVGLENWQFLAPVFFGDLVRGRNEIVTIEPHGRRAAKVTWLRQLQSEDGRVLQQGHFVTLVASAKRRKPR